MFYSNCSFLASWRRRSRVLYYSSARIAHRGNNYLSTFKRVTPVLFTLMELTMRNRRRRDDNSIAINLLPCQGDPIPLLSKPKSIQGNKMDESQGIFARKSWMLSTLVILRGTGGASILENRK